MKPVIIVAGLGRCGTTMTMHMLAAGGMSCAGSAPDYEDWNATGSISGAWLELQAGRAVKVLDPHRCILPKAGEAPRYAIWLNRDTREQAKSQAKFAAMTLGVRSPNRSEMRRWTANLPGEEKAARRVLAAAGAKVGLTLRLEEMLADPIRAASALAKFLAPEIGPLDVQAMARVVRARGPGCAPGLAMELELSAEARGAA